ncbi:unnamed protein product [Camellia sinensis]
MVMGGLSVPAQMLLPFISCLMRRVAILDGITMGGEAGISLPGMFRVVTDTTCEYLALTGEKLNGVEMIARGLATHYSLNARLASVEERLGKLITDDSSVIEDSLAQYGDLVYPNKRSILHKIEAADKCFSQDTVEKIIDALENEAAESYDEWSTTALKKLKEASPLSLKVTLQSIREGRFQSLDRCLVREYRLSLNWITKQVSNDFFLPEQGSRFMSVSINLYRAFVHDWLIRILLQREPSSLGEVTKDMVDYYFAPLDESEPELDLPTALREPSV